MKKLPTGLQEFSKLIEGNCIYVDKTKFIYSLLNHQYYFLSRPRRFGKSLLLNTIKEIFLGHKEMFQGLWIYDKIDWEVYPVIKISFSSIDYKTFGLSKAINIELENIANNYGINFEHKHEGFKLRALIEKLAETKKVVILIDEYDKPIIDYLDDIEKAEENRDILKSFYSIIKDSDQFIRFLFITGVSKFSKVSIFSDLNNLDDITLDPNFSTMLGWTIEEVEYYFADYLSEVQAVYSERFDDIKPLLKEWYNGYSWDGKNFVYNPVSLINLFSKRIFNNYWFSTGTPTFLTKKIKNEHYTSFDIENKVINPGLLDKYDLKNMSLIPLLFQTGYLTIKKWDIFDNLITLDYPNKEVADSFTTHTLAELTIGALDKTDMLLVEIVETFNSHNIQKFISHINTLFRNIPYTLIDEKEKYFHSVFYMVMKLVGFRIETEILTIDGRIDAVIKTKDKIYIIEFKINQDAGKAIRQIREKAYPEKYALDSRPKMLLGINFNSETRVIDDYQLISQIE